jgi:peptidoglycan hydrolase CwlO-like protein
MRKFVYVTAVFFFLVAFIFSTTRISTHRVFAEDVSVLDEQIRQYQAKITELQGQGKTLASQIAIMDNQVKLTEAQIANTKVKITNLDKDIEIAKSKVDTLQEDITNSTKALLGRINATYQVGTTNPWEMFLTSGSIENFFTRLKYLRIVQAYDKKTIYAAEQAKSDYENQKVIFEDKQAEAEALNKKLTSYTSQLAQEKKSKQVILSETRGSEANYQRLLKEAQAKVAAFKSFSSSKGGASILPQQASPDGWYFNQRDERWGNNYIGLSDMRMWEVGCLVTATAMVRKQRGENITPADAARESHYYAYTTADMRIPWNDGRFSSVWGSWQNNKTAIDNRLASGQPVIVGLNAGSYGTHFVVLKSGSNGDYIMNDPWEGSNLKFSDHYSTGQIYQYGYLN